MSDFGAGIFDDEPPRRTPPTPPTPAPAPASPQPERPAERARQPLAAPPTPPPIDDAPFTDEPPPHGEETEAGPEGPGDVRDERRPRRGRRRRGRRGRGGRGFDAPADADAPAPESVSPQRSPTPPIERPAPLRQAEPRRSEMPAKPVQGALRRWIVTPATPRQPAVARHGQRIGVLLDLAALQEGARQHGSELSYRRLLRHLTGDRAAAEAICFLPGDAPRAAVGALTAGGFQVERLDGGAALTERLTEVATAMAQRVDCLVLAPGNRDQVRLAQLLRAQDVQVETAGFSQDGDPELPHRQLGRDAVFLP